MLSVIVSRYWFGYVVAQARQFASGQVIGHTLHDRGCNVFGEHLGTFTRPVLAAPVWVEGDALSRAFQTESEALAHAAAIGARVVQPFAEVSNA